MPGWLDSQINRHQLRQETSFEPSYAQEQYRYTNINQYRYTSIDEEKKELQEKTYSLEHKEPPAGKHIESRQKNTLQIDLDWDLSLKANESKLITLRTQLAQVDYYFPIRQIALEKSSEAQYTEMLPELPPFLVEEAHWHMYVYFVKDTLEDAVAIGLQQFIGSDPIREFLSLARLYHVVAEPTVFYKQTFGATQHVFDYEDFMRQTANGISITLNG